jgi:lipopolysaccharide export system permease protein
MIFLYRLNKSSELIIIKSSGISVWKYLKPIAALVIIIGVSYTLFIDFGISEVKKYRENLADKYGIRRLFDPNAASLFKKETGLWLRENVEINQEDRISYLHAENVKQKGVTVSLIDIFIFEFDKNKNFIKKFEANEAFLNRGYLELKDARIIRINEKPYLEKSILYPTYLTKEKIQESYRSPETVSFWELPKLIKNFKALGFSAKNHIVHYNKLISYFLFLISMVMLASLFAVKINNRKGSAFVNFALGFFVTFTIFFAREFLSALSIAGKLPVFLGVWALPIVILFISLAALLHIEDG